MKGQKYKTVAVFPFDMPAYQSNYIFVNRIAIRDEIAQGRAAKKYAAFHYDRARSIAGRVRQLSDAIRQTSSSYLRDYYISEYTKMQSHWDVAMAGFDRESQLAVDYGHEANRLENLPRPTPTNGEWVRAHDALRLSRRPYRRQARINQRVAAFDYEDAAEHDVVDRSQLKWQRLVLVLAIILRNAQRRADSFIQPAFTGLGRTVRRCSGCLNVRPISEFPSIRTMWCNRCIAYDILLLS